MKQGFQFSFPQLFLPSKFLENGVGGGVGRGAKNDLASKYPNDIVKINNIFQ